MIDARSGKTPTTSVRRQITRLSRSLGLFDQICRHTSFGKLVKARMPARVASRWSATAGSFIVGSFFESVARDHSKDHAVTVARHGATRSPQPVHHSAGLHWGTWRLTEAEASTPPCAREASSLVKQALTYAGVAPAFVAGATPQTATPAVHRGSLASVDVRRVAPHGPCSITELRPKLRPRAPLRPETPLPSDPREGRFP